jgi:acetoin utilization protein AcuB
MTGAISTPPPGRTAPLRIGERMTLAPITIRPSDSCVEALRVMESSKIRHLPVLEKDRLVGILTRGDIYRRSPIHPEIHDPDLALLLSSVTVAGVMTYAPCTVAPATPVLDALKIMLEQNISSIPVVKQDRLVGIFTGSDGLRTLDEILAGSGD